MRKHVLVVDDSATLRRRIGAALGTAGYDVTEAGDGESALALLDAGRRIDLVVSDMSMPRMSGLELVQRMAASASLSAVPVILLSASADLHALERAKSAGVRAWLFKPFDGERLVATAKRLVAGAA